MRLCSIAKLTAVLLLSLASSLLLLALPMGAQTPTKQDPYLDPRLPTAQRVDDLVKRMTLAEKIAQMQSEAPAIPRLHIADYDWWNEGLHGVARSGYATVFPQAIGLAATRSLLEKSGRRSFAVCKERIPVS
jgi:beta-glucosidase